MRIVVILLSCLFLMNGKCSMEEEKEVYLILDKGNNVSSHFNIFHKDGFSVETDFYVTMRNERTRNIFVHECHSGREYYQYVIGKRYKINRLLEDNRR